ncbi:nucleotidyltransferase family protein [Muriicola sp.]|uniref:nucleotidyltransferase family protein n=1 Tax=Muriicola sp. TaxID=2020856 RepID=UPI003C749484
MNIVALILAAGNSSRMGEAKQLLPWAQDTLLGNAIRMAARSQVKKVYVVLGAEAKRIKASLQGSEAEMIINQNWSRGMGTSISCGVTGILNSEIEPNAILVMLADQPFLDEDYLNLLMKHFKANDGRIIATKYGSKIGVPAIFDKSLYTALMDLDGVEGANVLIAHNKQVCFGVDPGKKALDLDTQEEYTNFKTSNFKNTP